MAHAFVSESSDLSTAQYLVPKIVVQAMLADPVPALDSCGTNSECGGPDAGKMINER